MATTNELSSLKLGIAAQQATSVEDLIFTFEQADSHLKTSLEMDVDSSVEDLAVEVDKALEMLLSHTCESQDQEKLLCNYLMNRFLIGETNTDTLKKRVSEIILSKL